MSGDPPPFIGNL